MEHVAAIGQGVLGLLVLTVPGMILLLGLSRRRLPEWPFALVLAASFVLSCLVVAAWQAASLAVLGPAASRFAAWAFAAVLCLWLARTGGRAVAAAVRQLGAWERRSLAALGAILAFWLLAMPLSPYPGQITMELGDPPIYYRAASSLAAGRGWEAGYFEASWPGGRVSYVASHPAPALLATHFLQLFGTNWRSLEVCSAIAGVVLIYLAASLIWTARPSVPDGAHVLASVLAVGVIPAHFVLFGLGVVTAPSALAFLCCVACGTVVGVARSERRLLAGAALVLMLVWRPESSVLAALLLAVWAIRGLWERSGSRRAVRAAALAVAAGGLALLWWQLPPVMDRVTSKWQTLWVCHLRFDGASRRFVPMYEPWEEVSRATGRANFLGEGALDAVRNREIGREVQAHPLAFARYLLGELPSLAHVFVRAITVPQYGWAWLRGWPATVVAGALLALVWLSPGGRCIAAAIVAYFLAMAAIRHGADVRHMLTVSPAVVALAARFAWVRWGGALERLGSRRGFVAAGAGAMLVLAVLGGRSIVRLRTYWPNRSYQGILRDIERLTSPQDLVATTYPFLVTCMTGRRSVGGAWLTECLDLIIETRSPDLIAVDDNVLPNYGPLLAKGGHVPGYEPIVHNRAERYILYRRVARE